jgi:hypothetical protein
VPAPASYSPVSLPDFSELVTPPGEKGRGLRLGAARGLAAAVIALLIVLGALALALVLADALGVGPRHEVWRRVMRRRLLH